MENLRKPLNIANFKTLLFDSKLRNFNELALILHSLQKINNPIYRAFCNTAGFHLPVDSYQKITFLPIGFFKSANVKTTSFEPELVFRSSGTTGTSTSKHEVKETSIYAACIHREFELFYGNIHEYCILALLPSYLERTDSSLVWMAQKWISDSGHPSSNFFLHNEEKLFEVLGQLKKEKQKTILLGVTFALLDFAENYPISFPELIVMETGGMKGKRKELIREEIHQKLKESFGLHSIHAEYGMTELLSQAYAKSEGRFFCPPWMKIIITDPTDPFTILPEGKTGIINVIDLANIYSCAFIQTEDIGKLHSDGSFEVLGRMDNSDIRGCSLMYS